jgi:hypothetical protein
MQSVMKQVGSVGVSMWCVCVCVRVRERDVLSIVRHVVHEDPCPHCDCPWPCSHKGQRATSAGFAICLSHTRGQRY